MVQACPHPSPSTPPPGCHLQHRLPLLVLDQVEIEESGETHTEGVVPGAASGDCQEDRAGFGEGARALVLGLALLFICTRPRGMNVRIWTPVAGMAQPGGALAQTLLCLALLP